MSAPPPSPPLLPVDALHAGGRRLKIMSWAAKHRAPQEERALEASNSSAVACLETHARRLHEAKARGGCVSYLGLCLRTCFAQHREGEESGQDVADDGGAVAREERRSRLTRLLVPFREEPTKWELAARRLCQAGEPNHLFATMSRADAAEANHLLGLAYLACGREPCSAKHREARFLVAESFLRDGVALGADAALPPCAQAELHTSLSILYAEMSLLPSEEAAASLLSAGALHLSQAAEKFAAAGRCDMVSDVMAAAGAAALHLEDWESALHDFERAFAAATRMQAREVREAACQRRRWRAELGARFHRPFLGRGEQRRAAAASAAAGGEASAEGDRHTNPPPKYRRAPLGRQTADAMVRASAAGVVEALVRLHRNDEALMIADRFLSACQVATGVGRERESE